MKSPIVALPVVLQAAAIAALYFAATTRPAVVPPTNEPVNEIVLLHQQHDRIDARLKALESRTIAFAPRGMGSSPTKSTPTMAGAQLGPCPANGNGSVSAVTPARADSHITASPYDLGCMQ